MIFAAGLGTRLYPLTENKPKALVEIDGKPLLEILLQKLISQGFTHIVVNMHHFAEQVQDFFQTHRFEADIFLSDESEMLLDTGGGLKKALPFFDNQKPILAHNVDILSKIDLQDLYHTHVQKNAGATLAVSKRNTSRYLLFHENRFVGWKNTKTNQQKIPCPNIEQTESLAFSGIQVIEPRLVQTSLLEGKFSVIDLFLEKAQQENIQAYEHSDSDWIDVGTPEKLQSCSGKI